jgi:hypothetical protein
MMILATLYSKSQFTNPLTTLNSDNKNKNIFEISTAISTVNHKEKTTYVYVFVTDKKRKMHIKIIAEVLNRFMISVL